MKSEIATFIRILAGKYTYNTKVCTVAQVYDQTCDCTPVDGAPMKGVRLNAVIANDNGLVIKPVLNSYVLVTELSENDAYVSLFSDIESISIKVGNSTVLITGDEILFNGGSNNGLVLGEKLLEWMTKVHTDLLAVQVAFNGLSIPVTVTCNVPAANLLQNQKIKH